MKSIALAITFAFTLAKLGAVPIGPTDPVDLKGTIDSFVWIGGTYFEYEGDDILLSSSSESAHYLIIIKTESLDKAYRGSLSFTAKITGVMGLSHAIAAVELGDDEMIVRVTSPKIKAMKQGAKIEIYGYTLSGDERGTGESFAKLKLNGKVMKISKAQSVNSPTAVESDLGPEQADAKRSLDELAKMKEYPGSIFAQARLDAIDYRPILRRAIDLDETALISLFKMNFMGEGGETHSANLLQLMTLWGDAKFSKALASQPDKIRDLVVSSIDYAWEDPEWISYARTLVQRGGSPYEMKNFKAGPAVVITVFRMREHSRYVKNLGLY